MRGIIVTATPKWLLGQCSVPTGQGLSRPCSKFSASQGSEVRPALGRLTFPISNLALVAGTPCAVEPICALHPSSVFGGKIFSFPIAYVQTRTGFCVQLHIWRQAVCRCTPTLRPLLANDLWYYQDIVGPG